MICCFVLCFVVSQQWWPAVVILIKHKYYELVVDHALRNRVTCPIEPLECTAGLTMSAPGDAFDTHF